MSRRSAVNFGDVEALTFNEPGRGMNMPSRREVLAIVEREIPALDEQEFLRILTRVQDRHEAGCFAAAPDVALLLHRVPVLFAELIRLRQRNAELEAEQALASHQAGLFSINPNSR